MANKHTFEQEDLAAQEVKDRDALLASVGDDEDDLGVGDEPETEDLLSLDPKEWKVGWTAFVTD